jgi:hypothetical protein
MYDYEPLRKLGSRVSKTINDPIMIADIWELGDAFAALLIILIFGIIFYSWGIMTILLFFVVVVSPIIKKNNNRGIFLHWPYRFLKMSLPGIVNPQGTRKFSD